MKEDRLSEKEKQLFHDLKRESTPPQHLEANIIRQLIDEGEIEKTIKMNDYLKWAAMVAALVLFFWGGTFYEKSKPIEMEQVIIEPTKGYALLLHEDQDFQPGDPMEMFEEYKTWMENTFSRGVKITGQELSDQASVVKGSQVNHVEDVDGKRTTGYFLVEANTLEEAIRVAKENPHIKYGGTIEVKPFMVRN